MSDKVIWTDMEVRCPRGGRNSISLPSDCFMDFFFEDIFDTRTVNREQPSNYQDRWVSTKYPHAHFYTRLMAHLDHCFVVLLDDQEWAITAMAHAIKNCVILRGKDILAEDIPDDHTYFLPLHLHAPSRQWSLAGLSRKFRGDLQYQKLEAYVNGIKYPFDKACQKCPLVLDRSLGMCSPMHVSCKIRTFPFTFLLEEKVTHHPENYEWDSDDDVETRERKRVLKQEDEQRVERGIKELLPVALKWYDDHSPDIDALEERLPPVFQYKRAGVVAIRDSFEKVKLETLTTDERALTKQSEERSARAAEAAVTRKYKNFICKGCLDYEAGAGQCSSNGGSRCGRGPWYGEDYEVLAEQCKPWTIWTFELAHNALDAREFVSGWRKDRIKKHNLAGARGNRMIRVVKELARNIEIGEASIDEVCRFLGKPYATTWEEVEKHAENLKHYYGWPLPTWLLATAEGIRRGSVTSRRASIHGTATAYLSRIALHHDVVTLHFDVSSKWRNRTISISTLAELRALSEYHEQLARVTNDIRTKENELLKRLVLDEGVGLPAPFFRVLLEYRPDWLASPPEAKVWKKIVTAARKVAGKGKAKNAEALIEALKEVKF